MKISKYHKCSCGGELQILDSRDGDPEGIRSDLKCVECGQKWGMSKSSMFEIGPPRWKPERELRKYMWEILVPASNNKDLKFSFDHHKEWDKYVKSIAGGLTINKTAKGEWISPSGSLFKDRMIPVRVMCTEEEIEKIIEFTIEHYNQEAVLAYEVSNHVKLRYAKDMGRRITP